MHASHLLQNLALLGFALIFAKLLGGVVTRWGIPAVLAELFTGIFLGNLGLAAFDHLYQAPIVKELSEIGVLFLLFMVGLETDIKEIIRVGKEALLAAVLGVATPFALAFIFVPMVANDSSFNHSLFMAAALTATSVGITARVLQDLGALKSISGQVILGAAVIDDVLGIIVLTIVAALVTSGSIGGGAIAILLGKVLLFGIGVLLFRHLVLNLGLPRIRPLEVSGTVTVILFSLMVIVSFGAELAGLAGIIGAFALGVALDEVHFRGFHSHHNMKLEELIKPITDFLVPVFFIYTGMGVKLSAMANPEALSVAAVLIILAIVGKLACGLALGKKSLAAGGDRLLVGYGMIPRGEVGLIFATMGYSTLKILSDADYAAVVAMVAVTTLLAPGLIAWRVKQLKAKLAPA